MLKDLSNDQKLNLAHIGSLLKGLAHNINTPLSTVFGRAEMAKIRLEKRLKQSPSDEIEKCLKDISLIIENASKIHRLLDRASQRSLNCLSSDTNVVNIATVLHDDLDFMNTDMFFKHSLEKEFHIQENIPRISGQYLDFSLSFLEILENSKASMNQTETKKIHVSASCSTGSIEVTFKDTGCGIPPVKLEHIHNCLNSPCGKEETETGLMRVGRLMKPYGVKFRVESTPEGTTVAMSIPI